MLSGFLILVFLGIATLPSSFVEPSTIKASILETSAGSGAKRLESLSIPLRGRAPIVLAVLFFLYVGVENGFGGWIASYAKSLGARSPALPVMTPSFFYAALMVGRWLATFVLRKREEIKTARAGLLIACVGMAGLLLSRTMPLVVASVSVAGLGLAAVYPITISRLSEEFGPATARVGSIMFTMANLGGASLPWVVGYASHHFNDLRAGLGVPLACTVLMYLLYRRNLDSASGLRQPT
jgi:fucose permease